MAGRPSTAHDCASLFVEHARGDDRYMLLRDASADWCSPVGEGCASPWLMIDRRQPAAPVLVGFGGLAFLVRAAGAPEFVTLTHGDGDLSARDTPILVTRWRMTAPGRVRKVCAFRRPLPTSEAAARGMAAKAVLCR